MHRVSPEVIGARRISGWGQMHRCVSASLGPLGSGERRHRTSALAVFRSPPKSTSQGLRFQVTRRPASSCLNRRMGRHPREAGATLSRQRTGRRTSPPQPLTGSTSIGARCQAICGLLIGTRHELLRPASRHAPFHPVTPSAMQQLRSRFWLLPATPVPERYSRINRRLARFLPLTGR